MSAADITALYVTHAPAIRGWLLKHLPGYDPETADDLTADVFVKALGAADRYQDQGRAGAWLQQIAQRTLIDYARKQRPLVGFPGNLDYHRATTDAGSDRQADVLDVRAALAQLPQVRRRILAERFLLGHGPIEIAPRWGRSYQAIKSLQTRALRDMRELCEVAL